MTKVAIIKTDDRASGVSRAIDLLGVNPAKGKHVLIKPNFNTADPYPASTHNDTLIAIINKLKSMGAGKLTIGERSGPVDTEEVLRDKGIHELVKAHGVGLINFETLKDRDWVRITPEATRWRKGFLAARPAVEAECAIATCCLKTHGYGGGFTMSLKLAIGVLSKSNMAELHTSFINMKRMIAEANVAYTPSIIVMDALEAFTDRGPMSGPRKHAGLMVAAVDRVALDAVGVAILRNLGSNKLIMDTPIFKQDQIARAIELKLGVASADKIELVTDDEPSAEAAAQIRKTLDSAS